MLNKTISKFVFAMLVAASFTVLAKADTVYNYTGNAMACSGGPCPASPVTLTGSVTFANPLNPNLFFSTLPNAAPNSYDFVVTGGSFTSQHFTSGGTFAFVTNGSGVITGWQISFAGFLETAFSQQFGGGGDSYANSTGAAFTYANSNPGTWTVGPPTAPVPEPSSLLMIGTGALGVIGTLKKRYIG